MSPTATAMPRNEVHLRRSQNEGFTLVEAVVLIAIVGIVAASAAPRFLSVSDMDSVRAHRRALSDLRYARQLASSSGCPVQVDFRSDGYTLAQRSSCRSGAYSLAVTDPATNAPSFVVTTAGGAVVVSDVDPIIFDTAGRTTNASGSVQTANISIGGRSLEAIGETGLVRVP